MEVSKKKMEDAFNVLEHRIFTSQKITNFERRKEIPNIEIAVDELENELDRFQMIGFIKFSVEIDEFEERLASVKRKLIQMRENIEMEEQPDEQPDEKSPTNETAHRKIDETNYLLKQGKERSLEMLKVITNMKEELTNFDDQIMLQKEKMGLSQDKLDKSQSIWFQTSKIIKDVSQKLQEDLLLKIMIGLISVSLFAVVLVYIVISVKGVSTRVQIQQNEIDSYTDEDFKEINEQFFYNLEFNTSELIFEASGTSKKNKQKSEMKIVKVQKLNRNAPQKNKPVVLPVKTINQRMQNPDVPTNNNYNNKKETMLIDNNRNSLTKTENQIETIINSQKSQKKNKKNSQEKKNLKNGNIDSKRNRKIRSLNFSLNYLKTNFPARVSPIKKQNSQFAENSKNDIFFKSKISGIFAKRYALTQRINSLSIKSHKKLKIMLKV